MTKTDNSLIVLSKKRVFVYVDKDFFSNHVDFPNSANKFMIEKWEYVGTDRSSPMSLSANLKGDEAKISDG